MLRELVAAALVNKFGTSRMGKAAKRDIALGLKPWIEKFAASKGASICKQWEGDGLITINVDSDFEAAFREAVRNAKLIHFNLVGIYDLNAAFKSGSKGCETDNYTNWEFHELVSGGKVDISLSEKLRFYRDGNTLSHKKVIALLEKKE